MGLPAVARLHAAGWALACAARRATGYKSPFPGEAREAWCRQVPMPVRQAWGPKQMQRGSYLCGKLVELLLG